MGRVQEVAAYNTACNEYHGRQSKHNTTSHSSSHTLSLEYSAFPASTAQSLKCLNTELLKSIKNKKSRWRLLYEWISNNKHFYGIKKKGFRGGS